MIPQSPGQTILTIGSFSLHGYGLIMAIAIAVGLFIFSRYAKRKQLPTSRMLDGALMTIMSGFIGARLWHVWNEWWWYHNHLSDIIRIWDGGIALQGGLLFGFIALVIISRKQKIQLATYTDLAVLVLPLSQAIGRLGNYFNEELFGRPTSLPWALAISPDKRPDAFLAASGFHPLFLYELFLNLCLFVLLLALSKRNPRPWMLTAWYLIGYSAIRFSLDFLRFGQYSWGFLTIAQWVGLVCVAIGIILVYTITKRSRSL